LELQNAMRHREPSLHNYGLAVRISHQARKQQSDVLDRTADPLGKQSDSRC